MDSSPKLVNVGSENLPVLIPESALIDPDSELGREWWEMLSNGSVTLTLQELEALFKYLEE